MTNINNLPDMTPAEISDNFDRNVIQTAEDVRQLIDHTDRLLEKHGMMISQIELHDPWK